MSNPAVYTVAWICAIGTELVAAQTFLDKIHDDADQLSAHDDNTYTLGEISKHNIVIAALPHGQYGLVSAAIVARDMAHSFPNLRFALMVGVGGGAPSNRHDIRLGDIVVGSPVSGTGGVFQYDFGKTIQGKSFEVSGHLNQSPQCLLRAIDHLNGNYDHHRHGNCIHRKVADVLKREPHLKEKYGKPSSSTDRLFRSSYKHAGDKDQECAAVCADKNLITRSVRSKPNRPIIHYGLIASANQLMKDAKTRDRLSSEKDVLCFEMEAAGLMNHFPCLVIRGICDYSDTHKNKAWQGYAAMTAAAYAKDLLRKLPAKVIQAEVRLKDILSGMDSKLETITAEVTNIRIDKHLEDISKWLDPPDVSSNFNKAIKARHAGSGRRLLDSNAYKTWRNRDNLFLWFHGIAGCGKTILTSTVVEDLQNMESQSLLQMSLYFYFDFTDGKKQSFENTLRSFIVQMYYRNRHSREPLDSLWLACEKGKKQPSFDSLQNAFRKMIGKFKEVWIVLDALDECETRRELLSWIKRVAQGSSAQAKMHLLVVSRPIQEIDSFIRDFAAEEQIIAIGDDLLQADIQEYIHARVREHVGLRRWHAHPEIQDMIESTLLEKADGMFRWVSCQLRMLEDCLERKSLMKALHSLPPTLDETYERIIAGLPEAHMHHTIRILQFLTYSERPLRLDEAVDAIAVDVNEVCPFDPQDRLPVPKEITRFCSSLVVTVNNKLQLAHLSVKEYLTSNRLKGKAAQYLKESIARTSIAEVCLAYLSVPDPEEYKGYRYYAVFWIDESLAEDVTKDYPFAPYAAEQWRSNAMQGKGNVPRLLKKLCLDKKRFTLSGSFCHPEYFSCAPNWMATPMYYASLYGMLWWAQMLIDEGPEVAEVDCECGEQHFALHAAIIGQHTEIIKLLLKEGADVNIRAEEFGDTPLITAISHGNREAVQLLLDGGADVNAESKEDRGPLEAAVYLEYEDGVQLLLNYGAGTDTTDADGDYTRALQTAKRMGFTDIAQLLLNHRQMIEKEGWAI